MDSERSVLPASQRSVPKTSLEKIGRITGFTDILSLLVSILITITGCVDVDAMTAAGLSCIAYAMFKEIFDMFDTNFNEWLAKTNGGGQHFPAFCYQQITRVFYLISQFSTNFGNVNKIVMG